MCSYHIDGDIDGIVQSFLSVFQTVTGKKPLFRAFGGSTAENIALQNVQVLLNLIIFRDTCISFCGFFIAPGTKSYGFGLLDGSASALDSILIWFITCSWVRKRG
jgi:hypothetical protein